jgi:hypothetical protein
VLTEAVLVLSGALLNFVARVNQRFSTCGSRPPSGFTNFLEGVQKITSNGVSGRVVELVLLKVTRLTNQFSTCFLFLVEAKVFYETQRIRYSLNCCLLVDCYLQITFSYFQIIFYRMLKSIRQIFL